MIGDPLALIGEHLLGHHDRPEVQRHAEHRARRQRTLDVRVGLLLGLRVPVAVERRHERAPVAQVQIRDLELAPPVQVDGALVHGRRRRTGVDVADQLAGIDVDDRHRVAPGAAQREGTCRVLVGVPQDEGPVGPLAQVAVADQHLRERPPARPEHLRVGRLERRLVRRAAADGRSTAPRSRDRGSRPRPAVRGTRQGGGRRTGPARPRPRRRSRVRARAAPRGPTSAAATPRCRGTSRRSPRRAHRCRSPARARRSRPRRAARRRRACPRAPAAAAACSRPGRARSGRPERRGRAAAARAPRSAPSARPPCATS